jgi:hypothetical protein
MDALTSPWWSDMAIMVIQTIRVVSASVQIEDVTIDAASLE